MMVMVANQTKAHFCAWAGRYPGSLGHLYGPGGRRDPMEFFPWAGEAGTYPAAVKNVEWDEDEWRRHLEWMAKQRQRALWAVVPDKPFHRDETIEMWCRFYPAVRATGIRAAFAVQDGMTFDDVPTSDCMLFLGGSTGWKVAAIRPWCKRFPGRIHVGRVNEAERLMLAYESGAVSIDGTGWWHKKTKHKAGKPQLEILREFVERTGIPYGLRRAA